MPSRKPAPPVGQDVTLLRMKIIVQARAKYDIRGIAAVDILAPHCATALFILTRGAMVVRINGEWSEATYCATQPEGHRAFEASRALMRHHGAVKLRHLND